MEGVGDRACDSSLSAYYFRTMTTLSPATLARNALVQLNVATDRTFTLPLVIFYPTARCNSRCISCDWWKADGAGALSIPEIERLAAQLPALGVRIVLFSGGEALLRREVYEIADLFRRRELSVHLLTSGLFLERDAEHLPAGIPVKGTP